MAAPDNRWEQLDIYIGRNLSQLVLAPMHSADGLLGVLVFGTSQDGGFAGAESDLLERIVQPLRAVVELKILKQTQLGLLDAYAGPANAGRVFARNMRRREVEMVEGAMLLCELDIPSGAHEPAEHLIETLGRARSIIISSMKGHGAEIIELAAGRILALFPAGGKSEVCERAIACAAAISDILAIDAFCGVETGLAVHYGEIAYGGVEGSTRLLVFGSDFKDLETLARASGPHDDKPIASSRLMDMACEAGVASSGNLRIIDTERLAERALPAGAG
jgi:adenylate cyclase